MIAIDRSCVRVSYTLNHLYVLDPSNGRVRLEGAFLRHRTLSLFTSVRILVRVSHTSGLLSFNRSLNTLCHRISLSDLAVRVRRALSLAVVVSYVAYVT